jgi:hypothetical protein
MVESGKAAPAAGTAAGALSTTASTGAMAAADNAIALGMLSTPRASRCAVGGEIIRPDLIEINGGRVVRRELGYVPAVGGAGRA